MFDHLDFIGERKVTLVGRVLEEFGAVAIMALDGNLTGYLGDRATRLGDTYLMTFDNARAVLDEITGPAQSGDHGAMQIMEFLDAWDSGRPMPELALSDLLSAL